MNTMWEPGKLSINIERIVYGYTHGYTQERERENCLWAHTRTML